MSHVQMSDTEQNNFKTVFIVLVVCGKEALLYLLECELSNLGVSFENFINLHQHDLFHFCYNTRACCQCQGGSVHPNSPRKRILSEDQLNILLNENCQQLKGHALSRKSRFCCSPARTQLKADQLDITLLRCILTHFTTIYTSDVNVQQAVDTILNYRNRYAHTNDARITDRDYKSQLLEIETNILKIAAFCKREDTMKLKLQELLTKHSDTTLLLHLEQKFETCMNQVKENTEQLRLSGNSDTGTRSHNIIAQTEARIGMHENDITYVETSVVNTVDDHLKNHNVAVIVAKGGGGKTKLCLQLATIYKRKLYKPVLFADTQVIDKLDLISFEDKYFIILEDFFGRTNVDFDENVHQNTLDVLFDCVNSQTCNSKLLITIRNIGETYKHIFDKHKIFNNDIILDLDIQYCLTKDEREAIFLKHMTKFDLLQCHCNPLANEHCCDTIEELSNGKMQVGRKLINKIVSYDTHTGFPQACHIFCSNRKRTMLGLRCFQNASQVLVDEFKDMKSKAFSNVHLRYEYCILVYTAIKGYINKDDIDGILIMHIMFTFGNEDCIRARQIEDILTKLDGKFLVQGQILQKFIKNSSSLVYFFQHTTLLEAVLLSYGEDFLKVISSSERECVLDRNPVQLKVIMEYVRPKQYENNLKELLIITNDTLLVHGLITFLPEYS